jgi:hypothetical protein
MAGLAVSGEGGSLYVVKETQVDQGIQIPAISVWCCEPLPDSDILVGGSCAWFTLSVPPTIRYRITSFLSRNPVTYRYLNYFNMVSLSDIPLCYDTQ